MIVSKEHLLGETKPPQKFGFIFERGRFFFDKSSSHTFVTGEN